MLLLRRLVGLSLALLLAITSQAFAVARGASPASGYAVYCINGSMVTVAIDDSGHPVSEPHLCPDAVAGFAVLSDPPAAPLSLARQGEAMVWREPALALALRKPVTAQARGPPVTA